MTTSGDIPSDEVDDALDQLEPDHSTSPVPFIPRTGSDQPWDPEDLAEAEGRDPTPENIERARRELDRDGPAAIERTVP